MADYEIVDVHVHLHQDVAHQKAVSRRPEWPDEWFWCNTERIIPYMDQRHISYVVAQNLIDTDNMTKARLARLPKDTSEKELEKARAALREDMQNRVSKFNDVTCAAHKKNPRIIPFVWIDPVLFGDRIMAELERCLAQGAKGVKIHPDICGFLPDDARIMPIYQRCQDIGLWILSDSVSHTYPGKVNEHGEPFGQPKNFAPVLSTFPKLKLILAHFTDLMWDDRLDLARQFRDNVWFDIASGWFDSLHHPTSVQSGMLAEQVVPVFRKVGVERMLFGTDASAWDIQEHASQFLTLPFTEEEKRQILGGNAKRLLGLK